MLSVVWFINQDTSNLMPIKRTGARYLSVTAVNELPSVCLEGGSKVLKIC